MKGCDTGSGFGRIGLNATDHAIRPLPGLADHSPSEGISRAEIYDPLRMFQLVASGGSNVHFWSVSTHRERFRFNNREHSNRDLLIHPTRSAETGLLMIKADQSLR